MTPAQLQASVVGSVVAPGDPAWDSARLSHSGIGEPALIVRAASVQDVRAAIAYATETRLPVGVRGGGHSAWVTVPGGVLVDLHDLSEISIEGRRVSVGGGATWGQVARILAESGLGLSSGDTASVGVGGLTLGGGIGWMVRAWGLALDQLVGVELVTAVGEVIEVSDASHPDLFWALRGGGGNFGVVTRFDFEAHELPGVVLGTFRVVDPVAALRLLSDTMVDAPRELTVTYMDVPPMDPSAPAGATVTAVWATGDVEAARTALTPLRESPAFADATVEAAHYPDILLEMPAYDPAQPPPDFVGGNTLLRELDDAAIRALTAFRETREAAVLFLRSLGGAYGEVADGATAFAARSATWFAMAGAFRIPGLLDEAGEVAALGEWGAIEDRGAGSYGGFTTSVDREWVRRMYPPATWARLQEIKRDWDPDNRFSLNHNVAP